jgi:hypothetical protein
MKVTQLFALLGLASAECPNACSGHGTCGAKDSCSCYQNYQGNDCSERTCYFGIAHVDTPKGDLNADGYVSGPLTTVITGSEVYPWGTTEQYPNADANEGHFYMECSNKGMCDRKTGTCDCFDGYEGTACVRASCPNDCSGHGTCESIKEIAEQKGFNTNAHDVPTTRMAGNAASTHHNFDLAIEESYAYDLWDQDKTLGCKCDPVYYGADCSLKKCKYGVDPLFYDNADGVIKQTTVIHLGSKSARNENIGGTFRIVFYDVFGEKYVTKQIDASRASTSAGVRAALEALPNGVIAHTSADVTGTPPTAVTVSKAAITGVHTTTGTIGAGAEGELGAGLGVSGPFTGVGYGPEFTVTFNTNPGMLKSIELDTREINNPGTPDYWVANTRQGQFSSRYSTNLGRVQGLDYGSKLLYTNSDWYSAKAGDNTMVKIGGQEVRVTGGTAYQLQLSEPYLGASIIPTLTNTGASASAFNTADNKLTIVAPGTSIISNHLLPGAKLYTGECSLTSAATTTTAATMKAAVELVCESTHDCKSDIVGASYLPIYRRSDDPTNQNLYRTADTAVATDALLTTRGSPDIYVIDTTVAGGFEAQVKTFTAADSKFEATAINTGITSTAVNVFVNGMGPYNSLATLATGGTDVILDAASGGKATLDFASADITGTASKFPLQITKAPNAALTAGAILALNGRRYKVKSASAAADGKVTLTENFAGGQLLQLCSNCITDAAADGLTLTSSKRLSIAAGDYIAVGSYVHADLMTSVHTAVPDAVSVTTSAGSIKGTPVMVNGATVLATQTLPLYREVNTNRYVGSIITEVDDANPFQYVSQCSNRGTCDSATGVCKCFKGYSNDNCDNQNMLAM